MSDRKAKPGESYLDDGYYLPIESSLERKHGLPSGLLGRIRKHGEKTNRSQVSSAGARSVYQIIPGTRDAFHKKYGVNAYAGDREAAEVAALHLKESMDRNDGDVNTAVREYHGGTDRANWGKINAGYIGRVTGKPVRGVVRTRGTTAMAPGFRVSDVRYEDRAGLAPADIGERTPLRRKPVTAADVAPKASAASVTLAPYAGKEITPGNPEEDATMEVIQSRNRQEAFAAEQANEPAWIDRVQAAVDQNWIGNQIIRGLDNEADRPDPAWSKKFSDNLLDMTSMAQDGDEWAILTSEQAQASEAGYKRATQAMLERRKRIETINSSEYGWAYEGGAALLDPVGWLATYGVGKAFQLGRIAVGATKAGLLGTVAEGGLTGAGFSAVSDYSGENVGVSDYIMSGAMGAGMMGVMHGAGTALGKLDDLGGVVEEGMQSARAYEQKVRDAAVTRLGPDANPAAIEQAMKEELIDDEERIMRYAVGDRADADRFLPSDELMLKIGDDAAAKAAITKNGLENWPDTAEQRIGAEMAIRGDEIVNTARVAGELDKGLEGKFLKYFGQESDAITLLRSESTLMQAMAIQLLESTTGAGGRKASAALSMVQRNSKYSEALIKYENSFGVWAEGEGIGRIARNINGDARAKFDREVVRELRLRTDNTPFVTTNQSVRMAADSLEAGFNRMRKEMQLVKTLGHERLGETSKGYFPQHINASKILGMSPKQRGSIVTIMAKQLRELNEYSYVDEATGERITKNFDSAFSKKLAQRYLDEAIGRAQGGSFVPANLHTGEAAGILTDAVKAMSGLSEKEQAAILGRFSRGGASYTKGRLSFDMEADLGDGLLLGDVFENDILTTYRRYGRRVAGEVALAQYGVYGRQGLDTARRVAASQGASVDELKAFERIGAEFLNEPWGAAGVAYNGTIQAAQNLRSITAASRLGMMPFTQLGESGNAIAVLGVKAVLGSMLRSPKYAKEIKSFLNGEASTNPILKHFDEMYGFIGSDGYNMTRLFDAPDQAIELYDQASVGVFTRAVRAGAHAISIISGFRVLHATQVRGMSEEIVKKAVKFIHDGTNDIHLKDMGVTDEMVSELSKHMDKLATFDKKGKLIALDLYAAPDLNPRVLRDFAQTIERGSGQIIQKTYVGETGPWAHDEFLKFLFTFRTFGITSIEKQYGRNVSKYGGGIEGNVKTFAIMVGAMGFALPIHMARLQAQSLGMSAAEREKFMDERTTSYALGKALMNYTSVTGLAPDVMDVITTFGVESGMMPDSLKEQIDTRGRQPGVAGMIAPVGVANDLLQGTVGARFEKLPKLLPGANTVGAMPIFNLITEDEE